MVINLLGMSQKAWMWMRAQVLEFARRALAYGNMRAENREHQFPQRPGSHLSPVRNLQETSQCQSNDSAAKVSLLLDPEAAEAAPPVANRELCSVCWLGSAV